MAKVYGWMDARYDGRCGECKKHIHEGDRIAYIPQEQVALCRNCGEERIGPEEVKDTD